MRGDVEYLPSFGQKLLFFKDLSNIVPIPQTFLTCDIDLPHTLELGLAWFCFKTQSTKKMTCVTKTHAAHPWFLKCVLWWASATACPLKSPHGGAGQQSWLFPCHQLFECVLFCSQDQPWCQLSFTHDISIPGEKKQSVVSSELPEPQEKTAVLHQWVWGNLL
jgi:hypothetical protein